VISDGGVHLCLESWANLWEEVVCPIVLLHVHGRGSLEWANRLGSASVSAGCGSGRRRSREFVDDVLVNEKSTRTIRAISVAEFAILKFVIGARPAVLRVFVVGNRLWTDVDDMVNVGYFEGMFASVDWMRTFA
jgi:hypothetical protein